MRNLRVLVLDEADNMLSQAALGDQSMMVKKCVRLGFVAIRFSAKKCSSHHSFCTNMGNKTFQVVLFSATFPDHVRSFAEKFAPCEFGPFSQGRAGRLTATYTAANEIRLKQEELSLAAIKQFFMDCESDYARYDVLVELYALLTSMYIASCPTTAF